MICAAGLTGSNRSASCGWSRAPTGIRRSARWPKSRHSPMPSPAVLFDKIKDYPAGRRVLIGMHNPTLKRQCLTNHLPLDYTRDQFIDAWKKRLDHPTLLPPRVVDCGPVMENVFEGKDIDLLSLPVP